MFKKKIPANRKAPQEAHNGLAALSANIHGESVKL